MRIKQEDFDDFSKKFDDYVNLKSNCAVLNERDECGMTMDMYDLEAYNAELQEIAKKHNIRIFQIADDSDFDELNMYVCHIENVIIDELYKQIVHMVQYPVIV